MAGVDTILRVIGGTLALLVIAVVAAFGQQVIDPIYHTVIDPEQMQALGWGAPQDTVMVFGGLASIGLALVVILWWIYGAVRDDVRQEGPPGGGGPF